jgi:hypothetical protein
MLSGFAPRRRVSDLREPAILDLAISYEDDDARVYGSFAERLRAA